MAIKQQFAMSPPSVKSKSEFCGTAKKENKRLFDALQAQQGRIEKAFGAALDWQRLNSGQGCRVRYVVSGLGLKDKARWPDLQDKLIDAMSRLHKAFQPEIKLLK